MLWGKNDLASNSDIAATMQVNEGTSTANQSLLYQNTTPDAFFTNTTVGQFMATSKAVSANPAITHPGWVLRKEGAGLRAGRVTYEVLVAASSYSGNTSDTNKLVYFPEYKLSITTNPQSNTANTLANTGLNVASNVSFTVVAGSTPAGATLSYKWQRANTLGGAWIDVPNTAGRYFNNTSPTFIANNQTANANTFRVQIANTLANTIVSSNATVLYLT